MCRNSHIIYLNLYGYLCLYPYLDLRPLYSSPKPLLKGTVVGAPVSAGASRQSLIDAGSEPKLAPLLRNPFFVMGSPTTPLYTTRAL